MTEERWKLSLDGSSHMVELEHGTYSGKRSIRVDGRLLELGLIEKKQLRETGSRDAFRIDGHACVLRIVASSRNKFTYILEVDGAEAAGEKVGELPQADVDSMSSSRWALSAFFLLMGLGAGWLNWNWAHTEGFYSPEIAYVAPIPIVLALYIFLFPRDFLQQLRGRMSAITWAVAVVSLLAAIAHAYIFENIGY